jgi:hypothetical protein
MGYVAHHAIVVSSWKAEHIGIAHSVAEGLGMLVSPIRADEFGTHHFAVFPDGSKEGWEGSDVGDQRRHMLIEGLRDPALFVEWAEVMYGPDCEDVDHWRASITRHRRDKDQRHFPGEGPNDE